MEVAARRRRISQRHPHLLIVVDHENRTHGKLLRSVGVNHIVSLRHFAVLIGNDGEVHLNVLGFFDVPQPPHVVFQRIDTQRDNLAIAFGKLFFEGGGAAQLCGTNRRKVSGVRVKYSPFVAQPFVKINFAFGCFGFEVRSDISKS